jgi:N-sulfoglucosamine sulfohydrolase
MLNRREMMRTCAAAPATLLAQNRASTGSGERPPNIVFLISDDHSAPHLGCYGDRAARTPNLDRLAREGMRFNNCIVAAAQCSPNRSAILTGCSPHTTATSRLHTPMPDWEQTFLEPLQERGYFTAAIKKVHQGSGFDKRWGLYDQDLNPDRFFAEVPRDRPFFLHVGSTDPHRPYRSGAFDPPTDPGSVEVPPCFPDVPEVRRDLALYYDAIARMDSDSGRVLDGLRRHGLDQNTLVIFTGDNGMPFPRGKATCYDLGVRVPLLAWWPGKIKAGAVNDSLISHVDFAPTFLELAGLEKTAKMQGVSMVGELTGTGGRRREQAFSERNWHNHFDPMRSVRTDRYKLIANFASRRPYHPISDLEISPTWQAMVAAARAGNLSAPQMRLFEPTRPMLELYDMSADPNEFHNLADSPAHADIRRQLLLRLSEWMLQTYDFLPPAYEKQGEASGRTWPVTM